MATLIEYLEHTSITQTQLAEAAGVSRSYLNEIAKGQKTPRLEIALRIQKASGGKIDLQSLVRSPSSDASKGGFPTDGSCLTKDVGSARANVKGATA